MKKRIQLSLHIPATENGKRLDAALSQLVPDYSRAQLQNWIKEGAVSVNNRLIQKPKTPVATDDYIEILATLFENTSAQAEAIPLAIVFEDEDLLVINKPVGLVVHPGAGSPNGTLMNALLHYLPDLSNIPRAGIVHRLDKGTSGLLVIAKTLPMHNALIKAMQKRKIHREYRALVQGHMISGGTIDEPMGRHPTHRTKMAVVRSGREAITHYRVLEKFAHHSLLSVQLETGRTHQIRVHLAHIGYPIVGDSTYGKQRIFKHLPDALQAALHAFKHQALHAYKLALTNPLTKTEHEWTAPLPEDFQRLIQLLEKGIET